MKENYKNWLEFLDPNNLKNKLISISIFVATFESFNDYVVEQVKFLFNTGFDENGYTFSADYQAKVLSRDRNPLNATLDWLKEHEVINESDITTFHDVRKRRNKLVHEMMTFMMEGLDDDLPELFVQMIELRVKIEKWWILNVEIPTGLGSPIDIKEDDITTSSQIFNRIVLDMLAGDEKTANFYRDEFIKEVYK